MSDPLEYQGKRYRYSPTFDQEADPAGAQQLDTEEGIAAALVDSWTEDSLEGMAWWVIKYIAERFCRPETQITLSTLLDLQKYVEQYLTDWMSAFQMAHGIKDGPDDDEAQQAGKDLPLLVLAALRPEYVIVEEEEKRHE